MNSDEKEKFPVSAIFIIEVLGRPKEHVIETLKDLIEKIKQEKGVRVVEEKIHEAKEIEKQKEMFTSYAEIEVHVESVSQLVSLSFNYMPAHIEVLEPENISLVNADVSELLNEITRKMHQYDEIARVIQLEKQILENQLKRAITPQIQISENLPKKEEVKTEDKKSDKKEKRSKK